MYYNLVFDLCIFNVYGNVIKDIFYNLFGIFLGFIDLN